MFLNTKSMQLKIKILFIAITKFSNLISYNFSSPDLSTNWKVCMSCLSNKLEIVPSCTL